MSLPEFKFTNLTKPSNDTTVNSGLSAKSKMVKSGIVPGMIEKAQDTASSLKSRVSDLSSAASSAWSGVRSSVSDIDLTIVSDNDGDSGSSFFSFTFIIKVILIAVILWFMWANLANNGDFHLGMGGIGAKITAFFHTMEDKGRELIAKVSGTPAPVSRSAGGDTSSDSDSDSDDEHKGGKTLSMPPAAAGTHRAPIPPPMNNSSDKKPGFNNNDDSKYTFLDKASREYSGPSPSADDSTSATQKHQSGKAGYCYIGEDRGFRSCARVEAGDKCMSGQVYSRQEMCIDPTLRE
jgi:hypothetical protein